jgi:hypothetical protein
VNDPGPGVEMSLDAARTSADATSAHISATPKITSSIRAEHEYSKTRVA